MKNTTKVVIGLILAIMIALVIFAWFFDRAQAPQVVVPVQTIPANWKIYNDPVSGVSLQAPSGLTLATSSTGLSLIFATTTPYVHTHLLQELRIDIATPATDCVSTESGLISATSTKIINGISFERGTWGEAAAGNLYQGIDYTTIRNGLCYRVGLFTHSANGEGLYGSDPDQIKKVDALQAIDIQDLFALFDQIATTIKFTK